MENTEEYSAIPPDTGDVEHAELARGLGFDFAFEVVDGYTHFHADEAVKWLMIELQRTKLEVQKLNKRLEDNT